MVPRAKWHHPTPCSAAFSGLLFAALALSLGLVAVYSALEGGSAWVIALAAAALALWLGDLARRALIRRA